MLCIYHQDPPVPPPPTDEPPPNPILLLPAWPWCICLALWANCSWRTVSKSNDCPWCAMSLAWLTILVVTYHGYSLQYKILCVMTSSSDQLAAKNLMNWKPQILLNPPQLLPEHKDMASVMEIPYSIARVESHDSQSQATAMQNCPLCLEKSPLHQNVLSPMQAHHAELDLFIVQLHLAVPVVSAVTIILRGWRGPSRGRSWARVVIVLRPHGLTTDRASGMIFKPPRANLYIIFTISSG